MRINLGSYHSRAMGKNNFNKNMQKNDICKRHLHFGYLRASPTLYYLRRIYIGEIGRTAKKRVEEHESHVRKGNTDMSAVAHHVVNTGHCVHWQPRVIMTETNTRKRKVREALVIHRLGPDKIMNLDRGTELSSLWLDLVKK